MAQIEDDDHYITMDGYDDNGDFNVKTTAVSHPRGSFPYFLIGKYEGRKKDFQEVLNAHPMRGSKYSVRFNNCQHFVAIYTLFLEAFAHKHSRSLKVVVPDCLRDVRDALEFGGEYAWNRLNWILNISGFIGTELPFALYLRRAASMARPTVVASSAGAGSTMAATTTTSALAMAVLIVVAAGIAAGILYYYTVRKEKLLTRFLDPRISGFPSEIEHNDAEPSHEFPARRVIFTTTRERPPSTKFIIVNWE